MKRILILDTETTGLDPNVNKCIEVGCILYDIEHAAPVASYATLISHDRNEAEEINRIPPSLLMTDMPPHAWSVVDQLASAANAFVAHNAEFDRGFTPQHLAVKLPWICSKYDIAWPKPARGGDHLTHLALAYDLGVVHAHRAMSDCDTLSRIFTRVAERGHSLTDLLAAATRPRKLYRAMISYENNHIAKSHGFQWRNKMWCRRMTEEDADALPFRVREVAT